MTRTFRSAAERIEALLDEFAPRLGSDATAYGNHVRRVYGLVAAQRGWEPDQLGQAAVAAVFHDIGIWLDDTFDYLDPSRAHAAAHLEAEGLAAWLPVVDRLILEHHKIRPVRDAPLVEAFRRADLCDLSFGLIRPGIPRGAYRDLVRAYPVGPFRRRLVTFAITQARAEPLRPLPMLRW